MTSFSTFSPFFLQLIATEIKYVFRIIQQPKRYSTLQGKCSKSLPNWIFSLNCTNYFFPVHITWPCFWKLKHASFEFRRAVVVNYPYPSVAYTWCQILCYSLTTLCFKNYWIIPCFSTSAGLQVFTLLSDLITMWLRARSFWKLKSYNLSQNKLNWNLLQSWFDQMLL